MLANTFLPDGAPAGEGFLQWQQASQAMPFLDAGKLLQRATLARQLTDAEVEAYRAPFPDERAHGRGASVPAAGADRA